MSVDQLTGFITISLPIIGAIFGYMVKYSMDKSKELVSKVNSERREVYLAFVNLIIDIFSTSKQNKSMPEAQLIKSIHEIHKKYLLYSSPTVVIAFSEYFQYLYSTNEVTNPINSRTMFHKLSTIILEMRKDLGLSNKGLGKHGELLFRSIISDFDKKLI